jgi:hypothetical protein
MVHALDVAASISSREAEDSRPKDYVPPRLCGEQRVWIAVLNQAFTDATLSDAEINLLSRTDGLRHRMVKNRAQARTYLCQRSEDLDFVCEQAGYLAEDILKKARELRERGWRVS